MPPKCRGQFAVTAAEQVPGVQGAESALPVGPTAIIAANVASSTAFWGVFSHSPLGALYF